VFGAKYASRPSVKVIGSCSWTWLSAIRFNLFRNKNEPGGLTLFGRPFVKRFALCYPTVVCPVLSVCLSVLTVMLAYCGQTVGWIKMPLGMEVGLGPGHIVLEGEPAVRGGTSSPSKRGTSAPNFSPVAKWVSEQFLNGTSAHYSIFSATNGG